MHSKVRLESDMRSFRVALLALALPRYRLFRSARSLDPRLQIALSQAVLTRDRRILFVRNNKAAGKTVMRFEKALSALNAGPEASTGPIHGARDWPLCLEAMVNRKSLIVSHTVHPRDRAVAAFADYFLYRRHVRLPRHDRYMTRLGYSPAGPAARNFDVFLDYVELSFNTDELHTDRHWRKQVHNLGWEMIEYDHIVRIESLTADMTIVLEMAGITDRSVLDVLDARHNKWPDTRDSYVPDKTQCSRIEKLYADDFEAFGY